MNDEIRMICSHCGKPTLLRKVKTDPRFPEMMSLVNQDGTDHKVSCDANRFKKRRQGPPPMGPRPVEAPKPAPKVKNAR